MRAFASRLPGILLSLMAAGWISAATAGGRDARVAPPPALRAQIESVDGPRVIVKFRLGAALAPPMQAARGQTQAPRQAATLTARTGLALRDGRAIDARMQVLHGPRGLTAETLAQRLAAEPDVEYAVPDRRRFALALPNDPLFAADPARSPAAGQWYLRAPDPTLMSAINAVEAWSHTEGSSSIVVGVVDSGVLPGHPDLAGKLLPGYDFVTDQATARDGDGRDADSSDPGDWAAASECGFGSAAESSSWHGTGVAALIGARTNDGIGMASVGRKVMLLPLRALGRCGGTDSDIIAAMLWAAGLSSDPDRNPNPARVINLSLGSPGPCGAAYGDAMKRLSAAGVVVIAAAGNEGFAVGAPANCPGAIAVAGVRNAGTKVGYSSLGPQVAISAPAGNCVNTDGPCLYPILTAHNSGTTTPLADGYSDGDEPSVGTSFASPLVAGTAALMLSSHPGLTAAQVRALIQHTARPFPVRARGDEAETCEVPAASRQSECFCTTATCGAGLLDAGAAVGATTFDAPPVAMIAASAASITLGMSVALDGNGSIVGAGRRIVSYAWSIVEGQAIAAFEGPADAATAVLLPSNIGAITVRLVVTDDAGRRSSDSATVTVTPPPLPEARIRASASTVSPGSSVAFDGRSSSTAPGLSIRAYRWALTGGTALASFTSGTTGPTAAIATTGTGIVSVRLTVTDSIGREATVTRSITVSAQAPTARITASSLSLAVGESARLDGSGSMTVSSLHITGYQWALGAGENTGEISGSSTGSSAIVLARAPGTITVQLTVTDSARGTGTREIVLTARASDADRIFDWAEFRYPQYFPPPGSAGTQAPFTYRHYPSTGNFIGVADGRVYVHNGRDWNLLDVGALAELLAQAAAAGF